MVRAFYDGSKIQMSFTCLESHFLMRMSPNDYRYNSGKSTPISVMQKYAARGFTIDGVDPDNTN